MVGMGVGIPSTIWGCPHYGLALPEIRTPQKKVRNPQWLFCCFVWERKRCLGLQGQRLGLSGLQHCASSQPCIFGDVVVT